MANDCFGDAMGLDKMEGQKSDFVGRTVDLLDLLEAGCIGWAGSLPAPVDYETP